MILGGSYSLFAGRDATRALSKMELTTTLFKDEYDDLADLSDSERSLARGWHEDFRGKAKSNKMITFVICTFIFHCSFLRLEKYDIVGRLLKPGEEPSVYPAEDNEETNSKKDI